MCRRMHFIVVIIVSTFLRAIWSHKGLSNANDPITCGEGKECVYRHLCIDGTILENGENLFSYRFGGAEDICKQYFKVCCKVQTHPDKSSASVAKCGYRHPNGLVASQNSSSGLAKFGEFPWMLAIFYKDETASVELFIGGGSLIAPNIVMTAAHLVHLRNSSSLSVIAGKWDSVSENEQYPSQQQFVKEFKIPENFAPATGFNDIAILVLKNPFKLEPHISPICLPGINQQSPDHTQCFVAGWGKQHYGKAGVYSQILKKVPLPVVPHAECQEKLSHTRLGSHFRLHQSFMCAGGQNGVDACTGDGGGPLMCPMKDYPERYYQAGVVAWGMGCGNTNVPGIYADSVYLRDWIVEQLVAVVNQQ